MRIENSTNRNSSNAYQKKNKLKKVLKNQEESNESSDHLDLSSGVILLNHLLNEPEFRFKPIPFYFSNAATRNAQQAAHISKSIQQKAISYDVNLNYEMILDLVLSRANEISDNTHILTKTNINQSSTYQHISFRENETLFFEGFHNKSIKNGISAHIVTAIVIEYFQLKQTENINVSTAQEQIKLISDVITTSTNQNISQYKTQLNSVLKSYST